MKHDTDLSLPVLQLCFHNPHPNPLIVCVYICVCFCVFSSYVCVCEVWYLKSQLSQGLCLSCPPHDVQYCRWKLWHSIHPLLSIEALGTMAWAQWFCSQYLHYYFHQQKTHSDNWRTVGSIASKWSVEMEAVTREEKGIQWLLFFSITVWTGFQFITLTLFLDSVIIILHVFILQLSSGFGSGSKWQSVRSLLCKSFWFWRYFWLCSSMFLTCGFAGHAFNPASILQKSGVFISSGSAVNITPERTCRFSQEWSALWVGSKHLIYKLWNWRDKTCG